MVQQRVIALSGIVSFASIITAFLLDLEAAPIAGTKLQGAALDNLILLLLITIPFAVGFSFGFSKSRFFSFTVLIAAFVHFLPAAFSELAPRFSAADSPPVRLIGTWLFWAIVGAIIGFRSVRYVQAYWIAAYFFTICISLIGVCTSSLVFDGLLPLVFHHGGIDPHDSLIVNGLYLAQALVVLMILGPKALLAGVVGSLRRLVYIFSTFGLLSLVAQQVFQDHLFGLLWWIPHSQPPAAFQWFATLIAAILVAMTLHGVSRDMALGIQGLGAVVDKELVGAASALGESSGLVTLLEGNPPREALDLTPFQYHLPVGWSEKYKVHEPARFRLLAAPTSDDDAVLLLNVFQHTEPTVTDEEALKQSTFRKLVTLNATFEAGTIGARHGVMSHECPFQIVGHSCFVIRFVIHSNQFVTILAASSAASLQRYLADMRAFVDDLEFSP